MIARGAIAGYTIILVLLLVGFITGFTTGFTLGQSSNESYLIKKIKAQEQLPGAHPFIGSYWLIPTRDGVIIVELNKQMEELANEYSQQKQSKGKSK
jgi:hypothetical protein